MSAGCARGFSLIEIVIVLVILGIIAAIAIPRFGSAATNSANTAVAASATQVQSAIEFYAAEHVDFNPANDPGGSVNSDGTVFISRLLQKTDGDGTIADTGLYGPYLRAWPTNPVNKKSTVRIGGAVAGANTDGWRFDAGTRLFQPDNFASGPTVGSGH